jgi:hypothetical protein
MSSTIPADATSTPTPRTAIPLISGWTRSTVSQSNASSVPARRSVAPPCAATTSAKSFSCAIPSAVSVAVNASWSASPSPASLSLPASSHDESIALLTHQNAGSTSPSIPTLPILYRRRQPKRNRTPVASPREDAEKVVALKGRGFSRAVKLNLVNAALAAEGMLEGKGTFNSPAYSAIHPAWIAHSERLATTIHSATP